MAAMGTLSVASLDPSALKLTGYIAKGGFATCFRAKYKNDEVAVKVVPRCAKDAHAAYCFQAFLHECLLLQHMDHPYAPSMLHNVIRFSRLQIADSMELSTDSRDLSRSQFFLRVVRLMFAPSNARTVGFGMQSRYKQQLRRGSL
jgi:hypothetical protein